MGTKKKMLYAVTRGDYSDYHIEALTDTLEDAERIAKIFGTGYDKATIEEYECTKLDETRMPYRVSFENLTGTCIQVAMDCSNASWCVEHKIKESYNNPDVTEIYLLAKDVAHALKIGSDEFFRFRTENPEKYYGTTTPEE